MDPHRRNKVRPSIQLANIAGNLCANHARYRKPHIIRRRWRPPSVAEISSTATVTGPLLDLLTTADRVRVENARERFIIQLRWHANDTASVPQEKAKEGKRSAASICRSGEVEGAP